MHCFYIFKESCFLIGLLLNHIRNFAILSTKDCAFWQLFM